MELNLKRNSKASVRGRVCQAGKYVKTLVDTKSRATHEDITLLASQELALPPIVPMIYHMHPKRFTRKSTK
eukprot:scaffold463619_cov39-Prasinocladus_malaysianus.AAC.2